MLLCNVGPSRFTRLATRRLTFERSSTVPACPAPLSGPALHHHAYTSDAGADFVHWTVDTVIASGRASLPRNTEKPAGWWWQVRTGSRTTSGALTPGHPFALRLRVNSNSISVAATLKPLLDGLIAALQSDGAPTDEAVSRLAEQLRVEPEAVRGHIETPGIIQGRGSLVRAYRNGLQWNPADDVCIACTIERAAGVGNREVDWELLGVSPRSAWTEVPAADCHKPAVESAQFLATDGRLRINTAGGALWMPRRLTRCCWPSCSTKQAKG